MVSFNLKSFLLIAGTVACALAVPTSDEAGGATLLSARASTPSSTGIHDGFFYWWSTDGQGSTNYTNLPGGQYSLQWSGSQGLHVGGKGWSPGSYDRNISYSGSFQPNGNSYLSVYGWTRNPLIEYYIIESYGVHNPASAGQTKGTVSCDGAKYDIVTFTRTNQPSIDGIQTFPVFWSVRNPKKSLGTNIRGNVSTACHFDAWKKYGMKLGSEHSFQILATEGYYSSGSSNITVSD